MTQHPNTLRAWLLAGAFCTGLSAAPAQAQSTPVPVARLLPAGSEVAFTAKQLGVPLQGQFKRFSAQIALDPRQPQTGKAAFQIELGSVSIDKDTDTELLKPEWFNTSKFPAASFVSSVIRATGAGKFEVQGTLTLKGQARPLTVPVALVAGSPAGTSVATGSFTLNRLDFKVGDGDWADPSIVAREVQVRFKLHLQGVGPL